MIERFRYASLTLVLLVLLFGSHAKADEATNASAPAWSLETPDGDIVNFPEAAKGRPSVLLFWPSWCPFSRALQPYVQAIWEDYRDRGVAVWTINILENGDPVQTMRDRGLSFPLLLDGDPLVDSYGISRTPWLVVINGDNQIVYTRPANVPSPIHVAKAVRRSLNKLLGEQALPMPTSFPPPYDLHLKGRETQRSSAVEQTRDNADDWNGWAKSRLEAFQAGTAPDELAPISFDEHQPGVLEQSRQRWRTRFGGAVVDDYRQFRAFRAGSLWLTASLSPGEPHGSGLLLIFEDKSGRILQISRGSR